MRKIIYLLLSVCLLCSCEKFYGIFEDGYTDIIEVVAINRSSVPVKLNVYGTYWAEPQDTIFLKANNGLWKIEEVREGYYGDFLPIEYSVIRADFNDGERVVYFDNFSDLPHNPCAMHAKELWDDRCKHRIIEFSDGRCEDIFRMQDSCHSFDISMNFSPSDAVESLVVPGSTEGYFTSLYPAGDVKDKLELGAVAYSEAESIDRVRFIDGLKYEADTLETTDELITRYHQLEVYPYYDLDQVRNFGLTNFGCDFAALTGRGDGGFDSFCGVAFLKVCVGKTERIADREHPDEFLASLEGLSVPAFVVDRIEYGNFMLLLAEADCSHKNIHTYVNEKLLRDDPTAYYSYDYYHTPEISFHLITLADNGEFICQSGGEELAAIFYKGYENPTLHPLSYHVTDLKDNATYVHIKK